MFIQFLQNIIAGSLFMFAFHTYMNVRQVNIVANKWMSLLLFMAAIMFMSGGSFAFLSNLDNFVLFAVAPVLYQMICNFVSPTNHIKREVWLHFIPFFLFLPFALFVSFQDLFPNAFPGNQVNKTNSSSDWIGVLMIFSLAFQVLIYLLLSFQKLRTHTKNITLFASSVEKIDLKWLQYLLLTIAVMIFIWISGIVFNTTILNLYVTIGYFICIYTVAYFSHKQVEIFPYSKNEIENIQEIVQENQENENKTKQKRFSDEQLATYKTQLLHLMDADKVFLDDELSLPKLAKRMSISSNDLSYLINEGFSENFFQFINKYRVEEAKKLLLSEKYTHLNILGLAFESGFGSKSTFNATFKKMTGQSPSDFQKNNVKKA